MIVIYIEDRKDGTGECNCWWNEIQEEPATENETEALAAILDNESIERIEIGDTRN